MVHIRIGSPRFEKGGESRTWNWPVARYVGHFYYPLRPTAAGGDGTERVRYWSIAHPPDGLGRETCHASASVQSVRRASIYFVNLPEACGYSPFRLIKRVKVPPSLIATFVLRQLVRARDLEDRGRARPTRPDKRKQALTYCIICRRLFANPRLHEKSAPSSGCVWYLDLNNVQLS